MRPETRQRVEALVETLIAILDAADGDPDIEEDDPLEDNHDAEPEPPEIWQPALMMFEDDRWIASLTAD